MSPFVQPHLAGKNFKANKREPQKLFSGISPASIRSLQPPNREPSSNATTPGKRRRQSSSAKFRVNHEIERIQLVSNNSSRSVASSKPSRISASEYQIKTFAAAIDKNFLRAQDGQQVSIQTPNNHFQRPVSHPMDEYNLLPGPPDGDDRGLQQTERKTRQRSFDDAGDNDEEPRIQMPREGVSRPGSEHDGSATNDVALSGSNS